MTLWHDMRLALFLVATAVSSVALAQNNGNNGNNGNNNGNVGGIRIDADGVITMALGKDRGGKLSQAARTALAKKSGDSDLGQSSTQRQVSLVRLEEECRRQLTEGKSLSDEVRCLAGLTRIDFIFVDLEERDLILAGPAEPYVQRESGRWLGLETGRPVLLLDDLVVALRSVQLDQTVGCSIDPDPQRLSALYQFLKENSYATTVDVVQQRYQRMVEVLGNHHVRIIGVPEDSHFARGLIEADYRMKLLNLGLEKPGVKGFKSHLAMVASPQAYQRWWFVPNYDEIVRADDGLAFQLAGQRVKLLGEDQLANENGERKAAGKNKASTVDYAQQFTDKFPQLAAQMPVFAELQQLVDWTVLAALIRRERLAERIGWPMPLFLDAAQLPHETYPVPQQVACLVNTKHSGGSIIGILAGGVTIRPRDILQKVEDRADVELGERRIRSAQSRIDGRWWWD